MATQISCLQQIICLCAPDAPSAMTSMTCIHDSKQSFRAVRNFQPVALAKRSHSQATSMQGTLRQARLGGSARVDKHASGGAVPSVRTLGWMLTPAAVASAPRALVLMTHGL